MSRSETLPHIAVVFEDDEDAYHRLERSLRKTAGPLQCRVVRHKANEDVLQSIKLNPPRLVILDWELSKYYPPGQRELVRGVCREEYIPLCTYHQELGEYSRMGRLLRWNDDEIAVDSLREHGRIGELCGSILEGFIQIYNAFAEGAQGDLGEKVTRILSAPEGVDIQLEQYTWGQHRLVQVIEVDDKRRFVSTAIGYWVYNQLLQFPGLLVNAVAAASYLDIDDREFRSNERLQEVFQAALYSGPFRDLGPFFWLPILDEIRAEHMTESDNELISGWEVLRRNDLSAAHACCVRGHEGAGYYCLVTDRPVCHEHSVAPSGWIPIGADRSRIETDKYDELSAWLGF